MGNDKWFSENGVAEKLRVAIEDLRIGRGLNVAFRGLEQGSCLVEVVHNGTSVCFVNKMPEEKPVDLRTSDEVIVLDGDIGESDITVDQEQEIIEENKKIAEIFPKKSFLEEATTTEPEVIEEKPKRKRKKLESSES